MFGKAPISVEDCVQQLSERIVDVEPTKTLVLLYEPRYHHASATVVKGLKNSFSERKLAIGTMKTFYNPAKNMEAADIDENSSVLHMGGQEVVMESKPDEITSETFALLYIGAESAHLTSILMRYSTVDCFSYNPEMRSTRKEGTTVNRALMRR